MKPDVAVIIVTYNSADHIIPCLKSIYAQDSSIQQQVVVVDNDSQDDTASIIQSQFPQVQLILPGKNLGFAGGVNLGIKSSESDFVLLLNPDTEITENAIEVITLFAQKNPRYGAYGGRTLTPEGEVDPSSCWGTPTLWSTSLFAFGLTTLAPRNPFFDPESLGYWQRDTIREVGVITGCFLLTPRKVWEELKGLDERFFMYGEDVDFSMRARGLGYRPVICPDAKLIHEGGQCSKTPSHKMMLLYKGKATLMRTHWTGSQLSTGLFMLKMGTGLRATLSSLVQLIRPDKKDERWTTLWKNRHEWIQGWDDSASTVK